MKQLAGTKKEIGFWLLRFALSGVFVYAGGAKIRDQQAFSESIASFRLLPPLLINPAALALPPLEIIAGLLALGRGRWRRAGSFCLLFLSTVFLLALASAQARGLHVDCGCFGPDKFDVLSSTTNLWVAMARDSVLGLAAVFLYSVARNAA